MAQFYCTSSFQILGHNNLVLKGSHIKSLWQYEFFFYYFANSDCHFWTVSFLLTCEKGDQFCLRGQLVSSVTTQSRSSQSHVITFLRNKSTLTSLERLRTGFMWFALWLYCNRMGDLQCRKAQQVNSHLHLCPNIV